MALSTDVGDGVGAAVGVRSPAPLLKFPKKLAGRGMLPRTEVAVLARTISSAARDSLAVTFIVKLKNVLPAGRTLIPK